MNSTEEEKKIKDEELKKKFNTLLEEALEKNSINILTEDQIERQEVIGVGAFGKVYKGMLMKENIVAIKKLLFNIEEKNMVPKINEIVNEINIIQMAKHTNIPIFYGIWKRKNNLNLVFEYINGPMLKDFYKSTESKEKIELLIQLVDIIDFMHSKKLIHRDIKPGNVMIRTEDKMVKLIDFGTSKIAKNTKTYTINPAGTVSYIPPEAFSININPEEEDEGKEQRLEITPKYDIWSLGCMISEIFSGVLPWSNKVKSNIGIQNQLIKKTPFPIPKQVPTEIKEVILKCTEVDVSQRYSAAQLLEHLKKLV